MNEFACTNCGSCCGPVPVSRQELTIIKEAVKKMSKKRIQQLQNQKRDTFTCLLLDTKMKRCSVYENRPKICQMFGFYQGMACPNNPSHATKSRGAGEKELKHMKQEMAGVLTTQIKWEHLLQN